MRPVPQPKTRQIDEEPKIFVAGPPKVGVADGMEADGRHQRIGTAPDACFILRSRSKFAEPAAQGGREKARKEHGEAPINRPRSNAIEFACRAGR
jgi:hypothetical protein